MAVSIKQLVYRRHLIDVIGTLYGNRPDERIDEIRQLKMEEADHLVRKLGLHAGSQVMDLGSGMGHVARHIAPKVNRLFCCDVSESFLAYAKDECKEYPNVTFHAKPRAGKFAFLEDNILDAIYSNGVFIHLNIFDVYWYFKEFARVMKQDGLVCFNINSSKDLNPTEGYFLEFAEQYLRNSSDMKGMMEWLDPSAVEGIARHFGFKPHQTEVTDNMYMVFIKSPGEGST